MKKIKYFAIIAASIFTLTSCTDIVEVDDLKAKENKPSTGAPTVDKVVLATDAEFPIEGANFEQVVRIEGTNLGDITSLNSMISRWTVRRYIRHTICFSHLFPVHFLKK